MRGHSGPTQVSARRGLPRGVRFARTFFALLLFGAASAALSTASCGSPSYRCEGRPGRCSALRPDRCSADIGCPAIGTPVCVQAVYGCALSNLDGTSCKGPTCELDDKQVCRTVCSGLPDEASCVKKGGACAWLNGSCTTPCEVLTDMESCDAGTNCLWLACGGQPRACDEFSGDACPTWLGCDKVEGHAYSAQ